uniref:GPI-anchor transamidase component GPAA1 n=1 Tax=Ixodes ricinus TaxID=34613 RepID=A0A0K8R9Q0_IXORI
MGVLMNTSQNSKLILFVQKQCNRICFLSYVAGVVCFAFLAWDGCNNKTYFSENALLPGLVQRRFRLSEAARDILESLKEEAQNHASLPLPWLLGQFRQLGLDVYRHNFSLHYPLGSKPTHTGENVYAILRAPRAASTEAVVLSSPYRTEDNLHGSSLPGIALMIAMAKYFRMQGFWAKDIIFLVTEHELVGFQAWLDAYHDMHTSPGVIDPGVLLGRSGPIHAAINLELHTDRIRRLDLKLVGLNGQLPNLDLFNLVVELCLRESVHTTFHDQVSPYETESFEGWKQSFKTLAAMMAAQASGLPNGGHGLFHRYAIQALTLEGHGDGEAAVRVGFYEIGRVLEGVFCSLNNLLERFHQSFFFYLLPSTRRYISIGLYSPALALIALPTLVKAGVIFLSLNAEPKDGKKMNMEGASLWSALPCTAVSLGVGFLLMVAPPYLDQLGHQFQLSSQDSLYYGYVITLGLSLLLPLFVGDTSRVDKKHARKCSLLLIFAAVVHPLALVNISMATVVSLLAVPVLVTAGGAGNRFLLVFHRLLQLLIHPFVLSFVLIFVQAMSLDSWQPHSIRNNLGHAFQGHKKLVMFSVEDWLLYGNWTFVISALGLIPVWLQMWML